MKNLLRVVMLVLIVVAVYFVVTFLINKNNTYQEPNTNVSESGDLVTPDNTVDETTSGEIEEESGEELVLSGDIVVPEDLPEDFDTVEEVVSGESVEEYISGLEEEISGEEE